MFLDIARGRGETVASLSSLAGCDSDKLVGKRLQKNFKKIFPNAKVTDKQVSEKVVAIRGVGYELLDKVVNWCRQENLYVVLDMHAAPGGHRCCPMVHSWLWGA